MFVENLWDEPIVGFCYHRKYIILQAFNTDLANKVAKHSNRAYATAHLNVLGSYESAFEAHKYCVAI